MNYASKQPAELRELEALYEEDYKWLINRHLRILDEDPDGFMHYVKTLHEEVEISKNDN